MMSIARKNCVGRLLLSVNKSSVCSVILGIGKFDFSKESPILSPLF